MTTCDRARVHLWLGLLGAWPAGCGGEGGAGGGAHAPTVTFVGAAATGVVDVALGESKRLELARADADGDALTTTWEIVSATEPGVTCAEARVAADDDGLELRVPRRPAAVACADELTVRATVDDGSARASAEVRVRVVASATLGRDWVEDPRNPVVPMGTCPSWDCLSHSDSTLGRLPSGTLALWFAAGGDLGGPVVGRAVEGTGGTFARSPDAAVVALSLPGRTPPAPSRDPWDFFRETPSVLWNAAAERWDMRYLGYSQSFFEDPGIGQMRSLDADGTVWPASGTRVYRPTPGAWDADFLTSPSVVLGSDGQWRLYYVGASFAVDGGRAAVGLLTSADGASWTAHADNPLLVGRRGAWDDNLVDTAVVFVEGRYLMAYSGYTGDVESAAVAIGLAESEDGLAWRRVSDAPILAHGAAGRWNDWTLLDPEILIEPDGSLLMTAYGKSLVPPYPESPDFKPGRIGLWRSPLSTP